MKPLSLRLDIQHDMMLRALAKAEGKGPSRLLAEIVTKYLDGEKEPLNRDDIELEIAKLRDDTSHEIQSLKNGIADIYNLINNARKDHISLSDLIADNFFIAGDYLRYIDNFLYYFAQRITEGKADDIANQAEYHKPNQAEQDNEQDNEQDKKRK